jgi:hypothetical protein
MASWILHKIDDLNAKNINNRQKKNIQKRLSEKMLSLVVGVSLQKTMRTIHFKMKSFRNLI